MLRTSSRGRVSPCRLFHSENKASPEETFSLGTLQSFLNRDGKPSVCGGGRTVRTGRVEEQVEDILVIIVSSIAEVFVNG